MIRLITGVIFLWVSLLCSQAQATHIQYVSLADVSNANIGQGETWSTTFDLVNDSMFLWEISTHYESSNATPDPATADYMGSYDPNYALHYVTLRIDPNNLQGIPTANSLELEVNGFKIADWSNPIRLYDWGVPNDPLADPFGIAANAYKVDVTLTGLAALGNERVDVSNVNVEGCFDTANPIPEPATMFLFGTGLAGLVGFRMRRDKK